MCEINKFTILFSEAQVTSKSQFKYNERPKAFRLINPCPAKY